MEPTTEPSAPVAAPGGRKLSVKVIAIVAAIVVVVAGATAVILLMPRGTTVADHEFRLYADSDFFQLVGDGVANVTGLVTDLGDPVFGVSVSATMEPEGMGALIGPPDATTNNVGVATFRYQAPRRVDNVTVTFTLTAGTPEGTRVDLTPVEILGEGMLPTSGQVKGLVKGSGAALANATVQVTHRVAEESFLNSTDPDGRFVVSEVPPGTVSVTATRAGFRTAGSDVAVAAGMNSRIELNLDPLAAGTLVVWHTYEGTEKDEFNRIIARYHGWRAAQGLPAVTIEVEAQPFGGAIDKYITAALAGNAPDVMRFQNDRLGEVAKIGLLEPLDAYLTPADLGLYTEPSLESMSYQNRLYALPATADLLAIVYNRDIFTGAGEPFPTSDWTTDDLQRIARNLTDVGNGRWGYVQPVTDPFWWFPWLKGFGGDIFTVPDTQAVTAQGLGFDIPASARSLQWLQSLDKDPANQTMPARPGSESMMTSFFTGQAAMVAIGAWRVPDMEAAGIDFGIVPFPIVSETGLRAEPTLGVKGFGIYRYSGQKPASMELVKYITSPDQQTIFSIETDGLPTALAAFDNATVQANPIIILYQQQSNFAQPMPTRPEMGAVWNPITAAMEVVYNRANPSAAEIQADLTAAEQQIVERIG